MSSTADTFVVVFVCNSCQLVYFSRLKKFDPDNDDESLSNLETQCDDKDDLQLLHSSSLPVGSVEFMECGMNDIVKFCRTLLVAGA